MGDFDRNDNSPKSNETKKLVIVLALGVVLIGLVAMQFLKNGSPQTAAGAPVNTGVALPPPVVSEELSPGTLANMLHELQNDSTQTLLRPGAAGDAALDTAPRNPFRMSNDWLRSLFNTKPVAPALTPTSNPAPMFVTTRPVPPTYPAPSPIALQAADFKLTGILNGTMAVINGKVVKIGDVVGKARVIDITDNSVRLQPADFPNGPTLVLSMGSLLDAQGER
jgi:hypothetical protein